MKRIKVPSVDCSVVACNVYVTAARDPGHAPILLSLLRQAQQQSLTLSSSDNGKVGVVHAYADQVYNRSSFHLVGHGPEPLATVAADLASQAVQSLTSSLQDQQQQQQQQDVHHPYVGFVDHVSVMPLEGSDETTTKATTMKDDTTEDAENFVPTTSSGLAARHIGKILQQQQQPGIQVHYYGSAHPRGTSLATVRREKTHFFQSGGLGTDRDSSTTVKTEVCTIGAPWHFVENYNIRLRCNKRTAQSLTRRVRERDGGLPGVEALTLPYADGRWEVACNLLRPDVATSAADIDRIVAVWEREQLEQNKEQGLIEKSYRVGTTAEQCRTALAAMVDDDDAAWRRHNTLVENQLRSYLA